MQMCDSYVEIHERKTKGEVTVTGSATVWATCGRFEKLVSSATARMGLIH